MEEHVGKDDDDVVDLLDAIMGMIVAFVVDWILRWIRMQSRLPLKQASLNMICKKMNQHLEGKAQRQFFGTTETVTDVFVSSSGICKF